MRKNKLAKTLTQVDGSLACWKCSGAMVVSAEGECVPCPPGSISSEGEQCLACTSNTYPSLSGTECVSCGPNEIAYQGSCRACGDYAIMEKNNCIPCPAGLSAINGRCESLPTTMLPHKLQLRKKLLLPPQKARLRQNRFPILRIHRHLFCL